MANTKLKGIMDEQLMHLLDTYSISEQPITVKGINSYNQVFEITGKVCTYDEDGEKKPFFTDNGFVMHLGKGLKSDLLVSVKFEFNANPKFIALKIVDTNTERELYVNKNMPAYIKAANVNKALKLKSEKIEEQAPWQEKANLTDFLGKPVLVNNKNEGVLVGFNSKQYFLDYGPSVVTKQWEKENNRISVLTEHLVKVTLKEQENEEVQKRDNLNKAIKQALENKEALNTL